MNINFEFGETKELNSFLDRNPYFYSAFEQLTLIINKCFSREPGFRNRLEHVGFMLGEACRDDFLEILQLASQGYGNGASKLLRGLYEHAVTLTYIVKFPEKAERFVRYAAIQEYKAMNAALQVSSEENFDAVMKPRTTAAQIRELYEKIKPEFQTTACRKCKSKQTAFSWDIDLTSMVRKVGDPFGTYYLGAYSIPNLDIHATLASIAKGDDDETPIQRTDRERAKADFVLYTAMLLTIPVLRCESDLFNLGFEAELSACEIAILSAWQSRPSARRKRENDFAAPSA